MCWSLYAGRVKRTQCQTRKARRDRAVRSTLQTMWSGNALREVSCAARGASWCAMYQDSRDDVRNVNDRCYMGGPWKETCQWDVLYLPENAAHAEAQRARRIAKM